MTEALADLEHGQLFMFCDWPNRTIQIGAPGVYTIWRDSHFLYVGISYRHSAETRNPQAKGVYGRLGTHASGRRSGDQFNIYVCDRFVIPQLRPFELKALANGDVDLDARTKAYLRDNLSYRVWTTETGDEARKIEDVIRRDGLPSGAGRPFLNPKAAS